MAMAKLSTGKFLNVEVLAVAGGTQDTATAVPVKSSPALIVSAGDGVGGIRLPLASKGMTFFIKNTGTTGFMGILRVYPGLGDAINLLGVNNPILMATLTSAVFVAADSTTWYTLSFLPS